MRTISLLFVLSVSIATCVRAQAPDPVAYLNSIGAEFQKISHDMMSYTSAANHGKSARKVEKRRNELIAQVKESETNVRRLKPFGGSSALRDSIAGYFRLTRLVLTEDYGKIVDLEDIAEQSYDAMEAYLLAKEKAGEKIDASYASGQAEYQKFATDNNIKLIETESKLSQKLKVSGQVSQYTDKAYLLFFKSYKNEAYMLDAMSRNDINAVEQTRNAQTTSANADLLKAGELGAFNGDLSLKTAVQQALRFYQSEAETQMPKYVEWLVAQENFDKVKKSFDAKRPNERTKQDLDNYNNAVNDINAKANAANAMNQDLNKKRSGVIKNWNEAYNAFLDKHTPHYKR